VVPVVAGQSAKPAVAADAFTSGFNFGVLLCVLVLAGDDELASVAGGPGGGTVSVAGDHQHAEGTTVMIPAIPAGERCEALVASVGVDQDGVAGREANTAGTAAAGGSGAPRDEVLDGSSIAVELAHRRDALGSRGPPRSGT
jgi:hypothetical protein